MLAQANSAECELKLVEHILINSSSRETRVAVLDDGILSDIFIERTQARGLVGNVYLGRVVRVLPGMQSAFVDIGLERTAFLHISDIAAARNCGAGEGRPIEQMLREGQALMVQVAKDPIGAKGARLTTAISLAGRKLVYLPQDPHVGVSQRIEDEELREALREQVIALRPADEKGGYIIRTSAEEGAAKEELLNDMAYLSLLWSEIRKGALSVKLPSLLYQDLSLAQRVLRDMVHQDTKAVEVDDKEAYCALKQFADRFVPAVSGRLKHYGGERPLFDLHGVDDEIERALERRVNLKSGGYLVFDQTEAMTTIDVNTGAFVGKRDFSDTVFKTNMEAAQAIAKQLRLRNLGGIIIVDFIDMKKEAHREAVLAELRRAAAADRARITVSGFADLGLVAMTRKRTRESLAHVLCEMCPVCRGRGEVKTARTVCYDIMREIVRLSRQYQDVNEFRVHAGRSVIDAMLEEESQAMELLQSSIGKPVRLDVEDGYAQEQWDVVFA